MHADLHASKPALDMSQRLSLDCDSKIAVLTISSEMNFMADRCDQSIEQSRSLVTFTILNDASIRLGARNDRDC